ncbi:MAG: mechanosensitive ion channel domain-containing protein [Desulfobacterales bacterium]
MSRTCKPFKKPYQKHFSWVLPIVVLFVLIPVFKSVSWAQETVQVPPGETAEQSPDLYQSLSKSFDDALKTETDKLEEAYARLEKTRAEQESLANRISRIQLMISAHSNMLLAAETGIQRLEGARTRQTVASGYVLENIDEAQEESEKLKEELENTIEQIGFYERRRTGLESQPPHVTVDRALEDKLENLISILAKRQEAIEKILDIYDSRVERFKRLLPEMESLSKKIDTQIKERKRSSILEHSPSPLTLLWRGELGEDLANALEASRNWLFNTALRMPDFLDRDEYLPFLAIFLFFLLVVEAILFRVGRYCSRHMQSCIEEEKFWQYTFVKLLQKSLLIAGVIAYIYFYPVRPMYRMAPVFVFIPLAIRILTLIMVVRWLRIFLRAFAAWTEDVVFHRLYLPLDRLFLGVMVYGAGYFFISRVVCYNCITLVTWRLIFEFLLLFWAIWFFRLFIRHAPQSDHAGRKDFEWFKQALVILGFSFILAGIAAELSGFGGLAVYWYNGLAKTAVVLFWAVILFYTLRESDVPAYMERSDDTIEDGLAGRQPYPVRWLLVRIFRVAGGAGAVFALFLAWGAPADLISDLLSPINYKVAMGDFQLSLMGFFYALILLLVVHTLAVVIKEILRERILKGVDLEPGLKDSIVRITGYVLWMTGILIALRVVGVSATALTVVFGALGIGIGFGLQNIFNNFLSGIILLFERPMKVGDTIEINGIWGTVKEIKVRSSQVTTFDNSDMIIPNSDFINQTLTNWSFRDARVRRSVRVGVAHGSDIDLVRQILTDVAYQHPRVLRRPHPEVLFADFGENALIFELRFWAHVDWFLTVETDVRFDIDNKFRENNIRIPFPQRDIHFKTDNSIPVPGKAAQEQGT